MDIWLQRMNKTYWPKIEVFYKPEWTKGGSWMDNMKMHFEYFQKVDEKMKSFV